MCGHSNRGRLKQQDLYFVFLSVMWSNSGCLLFNLLCLPCTASSRDSWRLSLLFPSFCIIVSLLFYSLSSPFLHVCLLVWMLVAVQVGNMNYLAGRRCSAWKTAVSMVRMDEERQERDETDSSSQPSSIHPSPPVPSLPLSLSLSPSLPLSLTLPQCLS